MGNPNFTGGEVPDQSQAVEAAPQPLTAESDVDNERRLKAEELSRFMPYYDEARVAMDAFFAAGHRPPSPGNESY